MLWYLAKALQEKGYVVEQIADGLEGLARAGKESHDALILDRMLPSLDGLALIETLRKAGKDTPVLIVSALGDVDERVRGLRAGGDDYLVKPFAFANPRSRRRRRPARPARSTSRPRSCARSRAWRWHPRRAASP
jgi:two-component system, OmpR family, response regulator